MGRHLGFQLADALGELWQGTAIALLQLLDPSCQLLGDPLNLGFQCAAQARLPLVLHQQGFDLGIVKFGVSGKHRPIERVARLFMGLFGTGFGIE